MTLLRNGFDFAVDVFTSAMWAAAAFFIAARLLSFSGGVLLGLAVFVTALTLVAGSRMQEKRARNLAVGACPRCRGTLSTEHEHKRWITASQEWLPPLTMWRCSACGFEHEEPLACEGCPPEAA